MSYPITSPNRIHQFLHLHQPADVHFKNYATPSGLPKFKRSSVQGPGSADNFISELARRLKANDYHTDRYPEALPACCDTTKGDLVLKNLEEKAYHGTMSASGSCVTLWILISVTDTNMI
jgi:hypothetical protein